MNDDTYQRLSQIDEQLTELCRWLNEKQNTATASRLIPLTDDLTHLVAEITLRKNRQEMI